MTYDEAIAFWNGRINFEIKSATPSDLKLERMSAFLDRIGRPQDRLRIVHVTGTKGKGSTVAMIASVLQAAGYRVGQFTSPHLVDVRERMRIDGVPIARGELTALIAEVAPIVRALESDQRIGPSYFEIGTALGMLHFVRRRVDVAVVEVGLGGRFDSTNVCHPLVAVITSVGMDHVAQLGRTLAEIAYQKAGIVKPRVPVVCGPLTPDAEAVVESVARNQRAPLVRVGRDVRYRYEPPDRVSIETDRSTIVDLTLGMPGEHQAANAAVAVATLDRLRDAGLAIPPRAIRRGLESAACPARIEVIRRNPAVVLDSAHNVPSALALVRTLRESFPAARRKIGLLAVSSDKQYPEMMAILDRYFDEFVLTRYANNSRCLRPDLLAVHTTKPVAIIESAPEAWRAVRDRLGDGDLACVTGSVFLAGELNAAVRS